MTAREDLAFVIWEMVPADEQERLLDAYAAEVRSAAFAEAADWLVKKYGVTNRAASDLYRLAATPAPTTQEA